MLRDGVVAEHAEALLDAHGASQPGKPLFRCNGAAGEEFAIEKKRGREGREGRGGGWEGESRERLAM